jgi:hypothetical protein
MLGYFDVGLFDGRRSGFRETRNSKLETRNSKLETRNYLWPPMLSRYCKLSRLVLGGALGLLIATGAPALSACTRAGQTAQQRKTERYKRKKAQTNHIPCPTKDC